MERQLEKLKLDEPSKSQEAQEDEQTKIQEKCVSWRNFLLEFRVNRQTLPS